MDPIEEALKCPVCVDLFTDPIKLPCGHNFCQSCIRIVWDVDGSDAASGGPLFCPECQIFLPSDLKLEINRDLQQKVQHASTDEPQKEEAPPTAPSPVMCDQCIDRSSVAVKSCLSCDASLCSAHTLLHQQRALLRGHTLIEVTEDLLSYKCQKHGEELKLFCQEDQVAVCSLCAVADMHRAHRVVQLQEACSDFKKALQDRTCQLLQMRRKAESAMEALDSLSSHASWSAEAYKVRIMEKYSQMKAVIDRDQQLMMDILDMEVLHINKWLDSNQESLKCRIKDISSVMSAEQFLLQERNPLKFLQHLRMHKSRSRLDLGPFPLVEWERCTSQRMETVERLADSLSEVVFQKLCSSGQVWTNFRAIHFDAETAHPKLEVSSDMLEVRWSKKGRHATAAGEQVSADYSVLAREAFSSGSPYWEVVVWEKPYWLIGLSYGPNTKSGEPDANTSSSFTNEAFCYIYHGNGKYLIGNGSEETLLPVGKQIRKLGVWVDFQRGTVSFYDGDTLTLLHLFSVEFLGPVYPIFNPCMGVDEQNTQPLVLFSLRGQRESRSQ